MQERLAYSEGSAPTLEDVRHILVDRIPGCTGIERADNAMDRAGTDWLALRGSLPPLRIDLKLRSYKSDDDLALETWSVIERHKVGWTRDPAKNADYILWYWDQLKRFCLVPFAPLCRAFQRYWEQWLEQFQHNRQSSGDWTSECVFVPRRIVLDAIQRWMIGEIPRAGQD